MMRIGEECSKAKTKAGTKAKLGVGASANVKRLTALTLIEMTVRESKMIPKFAETELSGAGQELAEEHTHLLVAVQGHVLYLLADMQMSPVQALPFDTPRTRNQKG